MRQTSQDEHKSALDTSSCAMISQKSQCYPNSYIAAGSGSHGWGLELGCQCRLEGVVLGLKQQLSDWQLLITATRQNRTVKYYPSLLNFLSFFSHFHILHSLTPLLPLLQLPGYMCSLKLHFEVMATGYNSAAMLFSPYFLQYPDIFYGQVLRDRKQQP